MQKIRNRQRRRAIPGVGALSTALPGGRHRHEFMPIILQAFGQDEFKWRPLNLFKEKSSHQIEWRGGQRQRAPGQKMRPE